MFPPSRQEDNDLNVVMTVDDLRAGRVVQPGHGCLVGAGTAGLVAASIAAGLGARVALIERHLMGGDCLNTGCVPSKALIRSAKMLSYARRADEFGFKSGSIDYDFADVMRGYIDDLNTRIEFIRLQVERAQSYATLANLGGLPR